MDHLVEVVRSERIDVVLVSGDVYDRALPPVEAVGLFDEALHRLTSAGARVVLISGNHDSARRLGVAARLLDQAGVFLRTRPEAAGDPVLLDDDHGTVALYPIPYLEPAVVAKDGVDRTHLAVLGAAAGAARTDLVGRAGVRSVVLAHGWVHGGAASESERDVSVGGISAVPDVTVRRVRLRRPRAPARPADLGPASALQRLPLAVLLLRGPAHQGQLARRAGRRRSAPRRTHPCAGPPPAQRPARDAAGAAERRRARRRRTGLRLGHVDRSRPPRLPHGPAAHPLPAHAGARLGARRCGRGRTQLHRAAARTQRPGPGRRLRVPRPRHAAATRGGSPAPRRPSRRARVDRGPRVPRQLPLEAGVA